MAATLEADLIRNVTTLGHVDHGKTTLMDGLLAANNIISSKLAGKIRYLDSREDEQERGITMESSAVSLKFRVMEKTASGDSQPQTYVVNMIDTPGHVDFSSEVSTASRLVDGALILVDVVEGVSSQTISVLRQAWQDRLLPVLVINKIDRLVVELKQSPLEAYHHLSRLIEQTNAVMGSFFASERMEEDLRWREEHEKHEPDRKKDQDEDDAADGQDIFKEKDDESIYFAPDKGNVVFTSAIDGWSFRIGRFAQIFSTKLGIKETNLKKVLWGDFYLDPKTKRVIARKHLRGRLLKPLFVQFVLENIWAVYEAVVLHPDHDKIAKIVTALGLKIMPRDLKSKDTRHVLSLIFSQWLPLPTAIIQAVIDIVPSPRAAQPTRIPKMLNPSLEESNPSPKNKLEKDLFSCDAHDDAFVIAYVSKMFAVSDKDIPGQKQLSADEVEAGEQGDSNGLQGHPLIDSVEQAQCSGKNTSDNQKQVLLGFARLYSGIIRIGTSLTCVLPKFDNTLGRTHPRNRTYTIDTSVEGLYTMMGRELVPVTSVAAGNVFAIKGLEGKIWRCGTLCGPGATHNIDNQDYMLNLGGIDRQIPPIVRVALEPAVPADMPKLIEGMKLLGQADPCAEIFQQQTGELVISTAGELHLERCLRDLRERYAKVEIHPSKPIVPFRETAVKAPDMAPPRFPDAPRGTIRGSSAHGLVTFTIRALPLPLQIAHFVRNNLSILRKLQSGIATREEESPDSRLNDSDNEAVMSSDMLYKATVGADDFWDSLEACCHQADSEWSDIVDSIWAFGPHGVGGCLLIDARKGYPSNSLRRNLISASQGSAGTDQRDQLQREFDSHIETGFQLATFQGPLCAEPVQGMAYFVEQVEIDRQAVENERQQNRMSQVTGSLISAIRDGCRNGLLDWSPRLMLAMYSCDIQASSDVLGKVYGVVAKRRGRIVAEDLREGTALFTVRALLPVVESFGFADDIRKRTSGAASPQLIFSGFEMLDQNPFWVPTTEEELEDLGEKADRINVAKTYMDGVRARKGMFVDRKIVEFAEKQRTLKR